MFIVTNITGSIIEIKDLVPEVHIKPGQSIDMNYIFPTEQLNKSEQLKNFLIQGDIQAAEGTISLYQNQALVFLSQIESMASPTHNLDIARIKVQDEFISKQIDPQKWARTISGSGGKIQIANEKVGGQLLIRSGKVSGRSVTLHMNGKTYFKYDDTVIRARYRIEDINNSYSEIGLSNTIGQIRFERSEFENWSVVCKDGVGTTKIDTLVPIDQYFHWFGLRCRVGGIDFYIDGEHKAVVTTNIPQNALEFFVFHETIGGNSKRSSYLDAIYIDGGRE